MMRKVRKIGNQSKIGHSIECHSTEGHRYGVSEPILASEESLSQKARPFGRGARRRSLRVTIKSYKR
jgi:hypothetical protein